MRKKYCITCAIKKRKYSNCKKLSPKFTTYSDFFFNYKLLYIN